MTKCKFKAVLNRLTLKAPEEGGASHITNTLSMAKLDHKALAALCDDPEQALTKLSAEAPAKTEMPCGKQICVLSIQAGSKKHESPGVTFKKIVVDDRGGECQVRIVYQEPETINGCDFYIRNRGVDLEVACQPTQKTIDEEIAEKAKAKAGDGDNEE